MNELFLTQRWAAPAAWVLLHSLDYYLTLFTVRIHRSGVDQKLDLGGSVELNPVMEGALERRARIPWRFVVPLIGVGVMLFFAQPLAADEPEAWQAILGGILFMRLPIIGQHVHNIFFFRAIARGEIVGKMEYPRPTVLKLSALRYGAETMTLWAAAALSKSYWLIGGAFGMSLLVVGLLMRFAWEWLRRKKRSA